MVELLFGIRIKGKILYNIGRMGFITMMVIIGLSIFTGFLSRKEDLKEFNNFYRLMNGVALDSLNIA